MDADKLERLRGKLTFISGSSKNAGKTTFLNYLLPRLRSGGELVYLTVGIDGEKKDRIFGNEKPSIEARSGDYLITSEEMMSSSDALFSIVHVFPWKTALGRIMLLRTERSGLVELAGSESNSQLQEILKSVKTSMENSTVLVDGAVNRITQLAAGGESTYYYVMKVTPENRSGSLNTIRTLNLLDKIPLYRKESGEQVRHLEGALTMAVARNLGKDVEALVVDDFTKVFLPWKDLKDLTDRVRLSFRNVFALEGLVLNLMNIGPGEFEGLLTESGITVPFYFNPYRSERSGK
ncbi:MAG: hypothetical protein JXR86_07440 [Spirochaetales bacterium]|nr:hypothetical protein [Spirochaetales bacterium]